jgi:hypothetical protein
MINAIHLLLVGVIFPLCFTLAFITELTSTRSGATSKTRQLYGVPEWKAKFSTPINSTQASQCTLPLLLFPFEPTQILLPGKHTKLTFRHGKFMDMIDESLTSYESVVGMSVLDEGELLPIAVVCEVIEEEVEVKSGFRGVLSMEVGFRAVARMRRWDGVGNSRVISAAGSNSSIWGGSRVRYELDEVHLGKFIDFEDDVLETDDDIEAAYEYLKSIESLLNLSPQSGQESSGRQTQYLDAYNFLINKFDTRDLAKNWHAGMIASSWAVFAAIGDREKLSSVISQALTTKNTVERLRLGLVALLDSSIPKASDDNDESKAFQ